METLTFILVLLASWYFAYETIVSLQGLYKYWHEWYVWERVIMFALILSLAFISGALNACASYYLLNGTSIVP